MDIERQERAGTAGDRSVRITAAIEKLERGEALARDEVLLLKEVDTLIHRKIETTRAKEGGVYKVPPEASVVALDELPYANKEFKKNSFVASYSSKGVPVFRIFDDDGKSIVFRRMSSSPFFEQLSTDETVAWSEVSYKGVYYGVQNDDVLGRIGHAQATTKCNVEIKPGCAVEDIQRLNEIIGEDSQIGRMSLFSEFMQKVEMHVMATRDIKPGSQLLMDYGYDPKQGKPDNIVAVSGRARIIIEQKLADHLKDAEEAGVLSYWKIGASEVSEGSDESSSDSNTIIVEVSDASGSEKLSPPGKPQLESFREQWGEFTSSTGDIDLYNLHFFYESLGDLDQQLLVNLALYIGSYYDESDDGFLDTVITSFSELSDSDIDTAKQSLIEMYDVLIGRNVQIDDNDWLLFGQAKRKGDHQKKRSASESDPEEPSTSKKARTETQI
ncbi:hypothetical protein ElyMa_001454000 [Elysia marginata]|uniref:SET domain-containing protein n=1 Tax=Elysia marginata TaxID=1093978 RepID=A0AAV4IZS0_9GAST|nr:hypothetical protein ElyMa_001454000 [Elysia marginata]